MVVANKKTASVEVVVSSHY